jgi:hypothetical protein
MEEASDPVLGRLVPDTDERWWTATVDIEGRKVTFTLGGDIVPSPSLVVHARAIAEGMLDFDEPRGHFRNGRRKESCACSRRKSRLFALTTSASSGRTDRMTEWCTSVTVRRAGYGVATMGGCSFHSSRSVYGSRAKAGTPT